MWRGEGLEVDIFRWRRGDYWSFVDVLREEGLIGKKLLKRNLRIAEQDGKFLYSVNDGWARDELERLRGFDSRSIGELILKVGKRSLVRGNISRNM